jgi:hypothetical protein
MEMVEASAEVLSRHLPLITEENHEINHDSVGVTTKTRTMNLLNTNQGVRRFGRKFCLHLLDGCKLHTFLTLDCTEVSCHDMCRVSFTPGERTSVGKTLWLPEVAWTREHNDNSYVVLLIELILRSSGLWSDHCTC